MKQDVDNYRYVSACRKRMVKKLLSKKVLNNFIIAVVFVGVAFEKKGCDTFNSHVNCWKFYFLNHFEILPCIETVDSKESFCFD